MNEKCLPGQRVISESI